MTTLAIPQKIEKELKNVSQGLGLSKKDLIINAILFYLKTLKGRLELKKELKIWEEVSDEDLIKFEKKI